ncbi:MAG: chorismate mutase [Candidatus Pacebacteria bacterium]|nr:chorismate mutase [Candidatus Paceibacterota bacterium]
MSQTIAEDPHTLIAVQRHNIDEIDVQIAELLCKRYGHVKLVGEVKARHNLQVHDSNREANQMAAFVTVAKKNNVPPTIILYPFRMIIGASRLLQGEKSSGPIIPKTCMVCNWGTSGLDSPDGSGLRVCPVCRMPLI